MLYPSSYCFDPLLTVWLRACMVNFHWINSSLKTHSDEICWKQCGEAVWTDRWSCITPCLSPTAAQRNKVNTPVKSSQRWWRIHIQKYNDQTKYSTANHSLMCTLSLTLNDEWAAPGRRPDKWWMVLRRDEWWKHRCKYMKSMILGVFTADILLLLQSQRLG